MRQMLVALCVVVIFMRAIFGRVRISDANGSKGTIGGGAQAISDIGGLNVVSEDRDILV